MNLLFDTNILVFIIKYPNLHLLSKFWTAENKIVISVASVGELKAMALQNKWRTRRIHDVNEILNKVSVVEISESLTDVYAKIDAYSQRRNPYISNYPFATPRNMGKNDLWIASTAALLGLKLITTDKDFDHLHNVFIEVEYIKQEQLKS